jgi:hypothetical protein
LTRRTGSLKWVWGNSSERFSHGCQIQGDDRTIVGSQLHVVDLELFTYVWPGYTCYEIKTTVRHTDFHRTFCNFNCLKEYNGTKNYIALVLIVPKNKNVLVRYSLIIFLLSNFF